MLTEDAKQLDLKHSETDAKHLRAFCYVYFHYFMGPPRQPKVKKTHRLDRPPCPSLEHRVVSQVTVARLFVIFEAIFASFSVGGAQGGLVRRGG